MRYSGTVGGGAEQEPLIPSTSLRLRAVISGRGAAPLTTPPSRAFHQGAQTGAAPAEYFISFLDAARELSSPPTFLKATGEWRE